MGLRGRARERAITFVQRYSQPLGAIHSPGDLLAFPAGYSYEPPTLMQFGSEPEVDRRPWVTVGKYSSVNGSTRVMLGGGHHTDWVSTYPFRIKYDLPGAYDDGQPATRGPVVIGNDVWVGYDVIIQSGVTIGDGAVVATGAIVHRNVAPYSIVSGNPARPIDNRRGGFRFDEPTREALQRIRWWDWPHEKVLANVDLLSSPDLGAFIAKHG